ncbi:MAG: hypothetical protein ACOCZC_01940 [Halodesulfurarchaeum sp.]
MSNHNWGTGDVVSRRVGANLEEILPTSLSRDEDVHFSAYGAMHRQILPEAAVGGLIELSGSVGEDSQFEVTLESKMQRRAAAGGDPDGDDWLVRARFSRVEGRGPADLDPFSYHVEWQERTRDRTRGDSGVVSLGAVGDRYQFGRAEGVAVLLLTEILANRKAGMSRERRKRIDHAGSLAMLGSFHTAVDEKRIPGMSGPLDWETVDALLGPEAETLAASMNIETTVPERQRRAAAKGRDFLSDDVVPTDASEAEAPSARNPNERLRGLLDEIGAAAPDVDGPPIVVSPARARRQRERLSSMLETYPEGFREALEAGNFGTAAARAEPAEDPYRKMVMVYAFERLYGAILDLQAAERAVRGIAAAITAFGRAIDNGNADMAELSLKRASDAFVTITKRLVEGAKPDIEALQGLLVYEGLTEAFERHLEKREELGGTDLSYYQAATEALVEESRRQHERAEKAREAFYQFTNGPER